MARGLRVLAVAAALVAVQGVALVGVAGFLGVESAVADPVEPAGAWLSAALALLVGTGLLLVARGLAGGRRWARAPALVAELLCLPVSVSLVQAGQAPVGVPVLAVNVTVVILLFSPPRRPCTRR